MNSILQLISLALLSATLVACSSVKAKLTMNSTPPDSEVFARSIGDNEFKRLGLTPYSVNVDELKNILPIDKAPIVIEIRKSGYIPRQTVMMDISNVDTTVSFELQEDTDVKVMDKVNKIAGTLFEAQRLIRAQLYDEALKILTDLEKNFPYTSIVYELKGGLFYMKNDLKRALDAFSNALKYDPKNVVAFKMKAFIEKKLNIARPMSKEAE